MGTTTPRGEPKAITFEWEDGLPSPKQPSVPGTGPEGDKAQEITSETAAQLSEAGNPKRKITENIILILETEEFEAGPELARAQKMFEDIGNILATLVEAEAIDANRLEQNGEIIEIKIRAHEGVGTLSGGISKWIVIDPGNPLDENMKFILRHFCDIVALLPDFDDGEIGFE